LPSVFLCSKKEFDASCEGKVLLGTLEIRKSLMNGLGWQDLTPELSSNESLTKDGDRYRSKGFQRRFVSLL
jgi:hypothetical protein